MQIIETVADLEKGMAALARKDRRFLDICAGTGIPPLRRSEPGFPGLLRIIVGQQVSKASAAAIWKRVETDLAPLSPDRLAELPEARLREAGLSGPKIRAVRALANEVLDGSLDLERLDGLDDNDVLRAITSIKGLGPWSAEIYLLSCLGRSDAWPGGDLALQIAARDAFSLEVRPDTDAMRALAEEWRPWRAVAARVLWAHYALRLGRQDQGM